MSLRVALLHHDPPPLVHEVAAGLSAQGATPVVIASRRGPTRRKTIAGVEVVRVGRLPEGLLRARGFTGRLTHLPLALRVLHTGHFDVAHAFTPPDAAVALRWGAATGRPVVFTCERLDRSNVADARLRLRLLRAALDGADAVLVSSADDRAEVARWTGVSAVVVPPGDGEAHARIYARTFEP